MGRIVVNAPPPAWYESKTFSVLASILILGVLAFDFVLVYMQEIPMGIAGYIVDAAVFALHLVLLIALLSNSLVTSNLISYALTVDFLHAVYVYVWLLYTMFAVETVTPLQWALASATRAGKLILMIPLFLRRHYLMMADEPVTTNANLKHQAV